MFGKKIHYTIQTCLIPLSYCIYLCCLNTCKYFFQERGLFFFSVYCT